MSETDVSKLEQKQDELESRYARMGREFFAALYSILKTASLYEANNNRYISQANEFRQVVAEIFTDSPRLSFVHKDGYYFLNSFRIPLEAPDEEASKYFSEKFEGLSIGGFDIHTGADAREIDKFIYCFTHFKPTEDPEESLQLFKEKLESLQIENVVPARIAEKSTGSEQIKNETSKFKARKVFFNAISVVQEIVNQAKSGAAINLAKTKRIVQMMVDNIIEDESAMVELTVLRNFDQYTYVHSVSVCVLALIFGFHLNLDKKRLSDLGVGALLHDIGKISLPESLINKSTAFDDMDWVQMKMHPVYGVKSIIKTRGTDRSSVRAIATAYEHHLTFNKSGYPELLQKRIPCLFAQIVSICDSFNAMTSGRIYHKRRMSGDEVITNMVNRAGSDFNPLLLKVFINTMGIYPVGSVIRLNTDEIAIVSRTNPHDLEKPEVKVIADRNGPMPEVKIIDLSSAEAADVKIKTVIDGEKYDIDPANYIDLG